MQTGCSVQVCQRLEASSFLQAEGYRAQAAKKLVQNHAAVARFCLRGVCSAKAGKPVDAPLADPNRQPDLSFEEPMLAALQCCASALLRGTDAAKQEFSHCEWLDVDGRSRQESAEAVVAGLQYLRDRVGVPRDMQLAPARQLRAHLNFVIDMVAA